MTPREQSPSRPHPKDLVSSSSWGDDKARCKHVAETADTTQEYRKFRWRALKSFKRITVFRRMSRSWHQIAHVDYPCSNGSPATSCSTASGRESVCSSQSSAEGQQKSAMETRPARPVRFPAEEFSVATLGKRLWTLSCSARRLSSLSLIGHTKDGMSHLHASTVFKRRRRGLKKREPSTRNC